MSEDRAQRIVRLFPLVRRCAQHVKTLVPRAELDELIGDGTIGLIRAVDTYDALRGASLERYTRQVVVGAMLNGLRKRDPVSERARRTLRQADLVVARLAQELGAMPSVEAIEHECQGVQRALLAVHAYTPLSLDAPLSNEIQPPLGDPDPAEIVSLEAEHRHLHAALAALPRRERAVIYAHYHHEVPLRQIGLKLCISPQRASQLHRSALARLKKSLHR